MYKSKNSFKNFVPHGKSHFFDNIAPKMKLAMFDLDGTLLDSMTEWRACNIEHLHSIGIDPTPEQLPYITQASSAAILFDYIEKTFGVEVDQTAFRTLQNQRMFETYAAGLPVKYGVFEYLRYLHEIGVTCVITSATYTSLTCLALGKSGLFRLIDGIYCADLIRIPKREPEFFIKVSTLCGVPLRNCVLFEDSLYSIMSARKAGILGTVGVSDDTNTMSQDLIRDNTDIFVDSLNELIP